MTLMYEVRLNGSLLGSIELDPANGPIDRQVAALAHAVGVALDQTVTSVECGKTSSAPCRSERRRGVLYVDLATKPAVAKAPPNPGTPEGDENDLSVLVLSKVLDGCDRRREERRRSPGRRWRDR